MFLFNIGLFNQFVDRFLNGSGQPLVLPPSNDEVDACCGMSSLLDVYMDGKGLF